MPFGTPSWRRLTGGLIAIGVLMASAFAIVAFARVGSLRGDTYRAYVAADDATGIFKGTEVWLEGQKVGLVKAVGFQSLGSDTVFKTVLEMEVLSQYQPLIRQDSRVEFKSGGTFIGARVVALAVGSPSAPQLRAGDTLTRVAVIDPDLQSNELAAAGRDLPQIVGSLRAIGTDLERTQTQVSGMRSHAPELRSVTKHVERFDHRFSAAGTLPLLVRDRALADRARRVSTRADSLLALVRRQGTLGRIGNDSALRHALADTRAELSRVRLRIAREDGAAGRFLHDDAIRKSLDELERQITRTLVDAGRYPAHYSPF
jgi:ABC-type transporter Mla subunit MlaD